MHLFIDFDEKEILTPIDLKCSKAASRFFTFRINFPQTLIHRNTKFSTKCYFVQIEHHLVLEGLSKKFRFHNNSLYGLTTVIFFIVKSMTRVLFYFSFSDARTVVLFGFFRLCFFLS